MEKEFRSSGANARIARVIAWNQVNTSEAGKPLSHSATPELLQLLNSWSPHLAQVINLNS